MYKAGYDAARKGDNLAAAAGPYISPQHAGQPSRGAGYTQASKNLRTTGHPDEGFAHRGLQLKISGRDTNPTALAAHTYHTNNNNVGHGRTMAP